MAKKIRLNATIYDQPIRWDEHGRVLQTVRRSQGEIFEPTSEDEYDVLTTPDKSGYCAAEDPQEVQKRAEAELKARQDQLEAEAKLLEEQLSESKKTPEKLSGKDLDAALAKRGLPTDGGVQEKRDRLAAAVTAENPPT